MAPSIDAEGKWLCAQTIKLPQCFQIALHYINKVYYLISCGNCQAGRSLQGHQDQQPMLVREAYTHVGIGHLWLGQQLVPH